MLVDPSLQVTGNPGVENRVSIVGQNVYIVLHTTMMIAEISPVIASPDLSERGNLVALSRSIGSWEA